VSSIAQYVVVFGVIVSLLLTPIALARPRAAGRALVVPRARPLIAQHSRAFGALLALAIGSLVAATMSKAMLGGVVAPPDAVHGTRAAAIVWVLFGGVTATSFYRALRVAAREWATTRPPLKAPSADDSGWPATVVEPAEPTLLLVDQRRPADQASRRLRGTARWVAAAALAWYLLGRLIQVLGWRAADADVPGWWWLGTGALAVTGGAVWLVRRHRDGQERRRAQRTWGPLEDAPSLLRHWGFEVHEPAADWVLAHVPGVFIGPDAAAGPSLWPWAAFGRLGGHGVVVARQQGQVRNRSGLTSLRARTVCALRVAGARLPRVTVAGREAIPPTALSQSIDLELHDFNRALWAWGPDARGFHAVLHPRAMGAVLRGLPDGASLRLGGDRISLVCDEPVTGPELGAYLLLLGELAALVPSFLIDRT
jgi:hypothetical protein